MAGEEIKPADMYLHANGPAWLPRTSTYSGIIYQPLFQVLTIRKIKARKGGKGK